MPIYEPKRDVEQLVSCCEYKNVKAIMHFHRSIELIYVLSGKVCATIDGGVVEAKKDQIIFIPSGSSHSVWAEDNTLSLTLIIPYNYFSSFEQKGIDLNFSCLSNKTHNKLILQQILNIKERVDDQHSLLMQGFVYVVLGLIVENYRSESKKKKRNDLILDIVNYIELNYAENITLDKISAHFGYSKYYFSKLFNKLFGCTLNNYVNTVRCAVIENNKGIGASNAILNAGFNSLSSYYKFKKKHASH